MIFTSLPVAYAVNSGDASIEDEASISAENGLSKIIENLTEAEAEDEYANTGYSISDMTFDGITANVTVNVPAECTLVVAVYDEDTLEMISSATKKLSASVYSEDYRKDIISLDMNVLVMPEHFLAKAFLLDENNNALCKNYTCRTYTTQFEIFMETTPSDFEGKDIITMDDNCDDFGVLVDGAVATKKSDTMTYTYDNGVYTFYNAIDEVKNLKVDDIFYYQLSDEIGDFLLIKVVSIDVDGATVSITEDEEIALGDAFQFVRIDEDADFSDVELTEENLGSALSFQEPEMQASTFSGRRDIVVEETKSYSTSVNIKYPQDDPDKDDELDKGLEVEGSLTYILTASVNLYYDARWGKDFYELKTDLTHSVGFYITFSGEIALNKEAFKISFPTIPLGILELDISVYPVVSAEAAVKIWGAIGVYNRMSYTDSDGLTKINDTKWLDPEGDLGETEVEITIGLGVDFDIGFKKGKKDNEGLKTIHVSVAVSIEVGVKGTFVPSLVGNLLDKHHDCVVCLEGSLSIFARGKATLKLKIVSKNTKVNWDAVDLTFTVLMGEFYFSIGSHGMKLGFGTCPYISHKLIVNIYDQNGNPVKDAVVSTTTGYCDADGDKKFKETSMNTDENGQAVFYFKKGNHEVTAKKENVGTSGQTFEVLEIKKEINLVLFDAEYFNGHYYKVLDKSMTWEEAKVYCENLGGYLATITSLEEQNFITSIAENTKKTQLWLGGTDEEKEGNWKWITGEEFNYQHWSFDNFDNYRGVEHYLTMYTINTPYVSLWNDFANIGYISDDISKLWYKLDQIGLICEWEAMPTTTQSMSYRMSPRTLNDEAVLAVGTIVNGTTATRTDVLKGAEYVAAAIKDEFVEDIFANDNLIYIDQKTAESSVVSFDVVIPEGVDNYTIKIFGVSHIHTPDEAIIENENKATCTESGSYDIVTYCSVCDEELSREVVYVAKHGHIAGMTTKENLVVPTCVLTGSYAEVIYCNICTAEISRKVVGIPTINHNYENGICTGCGDDKSANCSHICHKSGFMGLIWKILRFFFKLFKIQPVCKCEVRHY